MKRDEQKNRPILPVVEASQVVGKISIGNKTRRFQLQSAEDVLKPIARALLEADRCLSLLPIADDSRTDFRKEATSDNHIAFYGALHALNGLIEKIKFQLGDKAVPPDQCSVQCANLNTEQNLTVARLGRAAFSLREWLNENRPGQGDEVSGIPVSLFNSWKSVIEDFESLHVIKKHAGDNVTLPASKKEKSSLNARMLEKIQQDPEARGWTCRQWQQFLGCKSRSRIVETDTWRTLANIRDKLKAERSVDCRRGSSPIYQRRG